MSKNSMLLYGRNSVFERLKANPTSVRKIFLQDNIQLPHLESLIKVNKIPVERVSSQKLCRMKQVKDLQGVVAQVDGFLYSPLTNLLNSNEPRQLVPIFLDRINDPQNLGGIVRILACFGGFALVISKFAACEVNETVVHVASGGENYVSISMVTNLSTALIAAKQAGYWIIGAVVAEQAEAINKFTLPFPLGLVLGSEGQGIRYGVDKHLDHKVHIPMSGAGLSFNVSMACAIFCYEINKQRGNLR